MSTTSRPGRSPRGSPRRPTGEHAHRGAHGPGVDGEGSPSSSPRSTAVRADRCARGRPHHPRRLLDGQLRPPAASGARCLARLDVGVALFFVLSGFLLSRPLILGRARRRRPAPDAARATCGSGRCASRRPTGSSAVLAHRARRGRTPARGPWDWVRALLLARHLRLRPGTARASPRRGASPRRSRSTSRCPLLMLLWNRPAAGPPLRRTRRRRWPARDHRAGVGAAGPLGCLRALDRRSSAAPPVAAGVPAVVRGRHRAGRTSTCTTSSTRRRGTPGLRAGSGRAWAASPGSAWSWRPGRSAGRLHTAGRAARAGRAYRSPSR